MYDWQFWYLDCVNCCSDRQAKQLSDRPVLSIAKHPHLSPMTQRRQPHDLDCQTKLRPLIVQSDRMFILDGRWLFWALLIGLKKNLRYVWHGEGGGAKVNLIKLHFKKCTCSSFDQVNNLTFTRTLNQIWSDQSRYCAFDSHGGKMTAAVIELFQFWFWWCLILPLFLSLND